MLRVSEHYELTDTGRQRRANEDSLFARSPLFVVADGMGGAQAGEVASQTAVEVFSQGLPDGGSAEARLQARVIEANRAIHQLSREDAGRAGMGTTLTAAYVGDEDVAIAHVGDSRAYRWRDGALERLTEDHSLVEELKRQGKLTDEEADEHPQRSIITRALGPEPAVEVDTLTAPARHGDVFLLCSDGLTSMIGEAAIADVLGRHEALSDAARALVGAANEAGGRDNITVVLFRVEEVGVGGGGVDRTTEAHQATSVATALTTDQVRAAVAEREVQAVQPRTPRPRVAGAPPRRRRWGARAGAALVVTALLGAIAIGLYAAINSVYFVGTDEDGRVALFKGLPYELPLGIDLYRTEYRTGVPAASIPPARRATLLDHQLRSHDDAVDLVRQFELGQLQGS
ncbi:MAG TPA: Stp1/IreP family PP2C-type Ser/Thr phosphatase [Capillimicrobium sp.]|nr:Stp1/IreP family PP2C-type Ser/Thr phosphatase [Capillimicrobium sp.]